MPNWRNELPSTRRHMGFDLKRTPTNAPLEAIITCDDLTVCDTHFWHGRTTPCEAPDCPACNEAIPYRTHVYISAYEPRQAQHFIFECTTHAAKPLAEYRQASGTLRGCLFHATRPARTPNGRVLIETNTVNLAKVKLPTAPNVILALSVIWRLPLTGLAIEHERHHDPKVKTRKPPIDRMRQQPDNQPDPARMDTILASPGNNEPPAKPK